MIDLDWTRLGAGMFMARMDGKAGETFDVFLGGKRGSWQWWITRTASAEQLLAGTSSSAHCAKSDAAWGFAAVLAKGGTS